MRPFVRFNRGVLRMPLPWRLWLGLLVAANMVVPLLFLGTLEGRAVLGAFLLSVGLMTLITGPTGFSRPMPSPRTITGSIASIAAPGPRRWTSGPGSNASRKV